MLKSLSHYKLLYLEAKEMKDINECYFAMDNLYERLVHDIAHYQLAKRDNKAYFIDGDIKEYFLLSEKVLQGVKRKW